MTRDEFDGGWKILTGVWPTAKHDPEIYFGLLAELPVATWMAAVRSCAARCEFFPLPFVLLETGYQVERVAGATAFDEGRRAEIRALPPAKPDKYLGHPLCPALPGEDFFRYLERLAIALGYMEAAK